MSMMLTGYSEHGCQEFILPEIDNTNYSVSLDHRLFRVPEDIDLHFDVVTGKWRFLRCSVNGTLLTKGIQPGDPLCSGNSIYISVGTAQIAIIVTEFTASMDGFKKYRVPKSFQLLIGSDEDNHVVCSDNGFISRHHASLNIDHSNCLLTDISTNGTFVNGLRVRGTESIEYGTCVNLFGVQVIWLGDIVAIGSKHGHIECKLDPVSDHTPHAPQPHSGICPNKQYFRRSPRNLPALFEERIEVEGPPQPQKTAKRPLILTIGPSLTMALPMVIGTGVAILGAQSNGASASIYMFTGIMIAILSALIGTTWAIINLRYSKKQETENEAYRVKKYEDYIDSIDKSIAEKYTYNEQSLNYIYPDATTLSKYNADTSEMWNRNATHQDFLYLRLGVGALPFQCPIVVPQQKFTLIDDALASEPDSVLHKYQFLRGVPVGIDLSGKKLIGVVSQSKEQSSLVLRNLVVQAAANICYTDIKMVFLFDGSTPSETTIWSFARWLPHTWSVDRKIRYFAATENERSEVCFALANVLRVRAEDETRVNKARPHPHYMVFVSNPDLLEGEPVAKYLLSSDADIGVTTFLFAERYEQLPNNCVDIIENDPEFSGILNIEHGDSARTKLTFDPIDLAAAEQFTRTISSVEVRETETGGEVPDSLSFLDMYHVNKLSDLNVAERWLKNRTYENMRVPIGQKAGGVTWNLDIHEKYHGPHGLVAGTTGSGKSETLQTYILSLAVNFSPNDVAFFLIDFKGGGMANLFSDLPHTAGFISNLSGTQIHRAMVSIKSENRRRQRIFGQYGVNHIDQYTKLFKSGEAAVPIPHLFIIIDEFAELKRDEPDFMRELISVAQVGRSLGVHLILATQKPSGTVDDNIWSNTRFRLCLRVQDRQDSNDVLHKPDAAYLTQAGRGYMQVGNDEVYELFQSGWSGVAYYDDVTAVQNEVAYIWGNTGKESILGANRRPPQSNPRKGAVTGAREKTQLTAITEHIRQIVSTTLANEPFRLWLPILPQAIYLYDICHEPMFNGERWPVRNDASLSTIVGIYDDPANQTQNPLTLDLAGSGNVIVCGTVASGKSTFLQTFLYALVNKYSPDQVNLYVLDYSNHLLASFEKAAHCGGVVFDNEPDKTGKLFVLLSNIVGERKKMFQGGNYAQYVKANGQRVPNIVVVIDNYAGFREKTDNRFEPDLIQLSREGANYGIHLVVSCGGIGASEIQNRIADNFRMVLCLEMSDRFKYAEVLRVRHIDVFPEADIKGRGLVNVGGRILEYQTALALKANDDYERAEKLEVCFDEMNHVWDGSCARKIPSIPDEPTWSDFINYENIKDESLHRAGLLPFAWVSKDATIASIDLAKTYCWTISGRAKTGKTNLLKVLCASAAFSTSERYIMDFSCNRLRKFADKNQAVYVSDGKALFEVMKSLVQTFKERNAKKQELISEGYDEEDIFREMRTFTPIYLFIDNLYDFLKNVYNPPEGVGSAAGFLENITEKGYLHNIFIISVLDPSNAAQFSALKAYANIVSYKTGIHLGGNVAAQRLFDFSGLSYQEQSKATRPGQGLLPSNGYGAAPTEVIIPNMKV